jgi:hypothetical protein
MNTTFEKKDMMVSLEAAELEIERQVAEKEKELSATIKALAGTINLMKACAPIGGLIKPDHGINVQYPVGYPVGLTLDNGVGLYSGDEVILPSGRKGIVVEHGSEIRIITNNNSDSRRLAAVAGRYSAYTVTPSQITVSRHYNTYSDGMEIAPGRNGGKGFIVSITEGEKK